ncbi:MAG: N-acetyltransferase family protein [Haloarculaceae archaeon]
MEPRAYDPERDRAALWTLKAAFERELGSADPEKEAAYERKLTDDYRADYLSWVDRCVADDPACVQVVPGESGLAGYAFLLPDRLAYVWDAAVLNELYVREAARGTGLADALLERALAVARAQDLPLDRLLLDVDASNERARAFYDRYGFEPWGELVARPL